MKLKPGDKAPELSGNDESGNIVSLKDYKGRKLILFFYPKDDTEGCTAESCSLRDNYSKLKKLGFDILGVSADTNKKHMKFRDKYQLPFRLLADTEKEVINRYGVWGEKKFMGRVFDGIIRTTFVIDQNGFITHIVDKVKTKNHGEQIISLISN